MFSEQERTAIDEIRCLCADMVQTANSGHPGAPIGMSPALYVLFTKFLRYTPTNPEWIARDRLILSNGHASSILYAMLHLSGYGYQMDDLKKFRSLHSKTPGHPERVEYSSGRRNEAIEVTTGPLGQGVSNAIGMAIAMEALKQYDKDSVAVDSEQRVYAFCGDGCLQEGISSEACSLAGTRKLKDVIVLYDDNNITIDGPTDLTFTEDVTKRYEAYGWNVVVVPNADTDLDCIYAAIAQARSSDKPTLIRLKTTIGFGAQQQNTNAVHGAPLGASQVAALKKHYGFPENEFFRITQPTYDLFKQATEKANNNYKTWLTKFESCSYKQQLVDRFNFVHSLTVEKMASIFQEHKKAYQTAMKGKATRHHSQAILQLLFDGIFHDYMILGSADLSPSCMTLLKNFPPKQYIHFGIREMAMCAISNGIAAYGGFVPFDSTFMSFYTYCMGSIRVGAISRLLGIHIFTHDSIYVGEDGCTHQPVELMAQIRAMIGVYDWRPCDSVETMGAYAGALGKNSHQHILSLTRQNVSDVENTDILKAATHGGYVVLENKSAKYTILSTGSEVAPSVAVAKALGLRVVSMPSYKLFSEQTSEYKQSVLKHDRQHIISVEPFISMGMDRFAQHHVSIEEYGVSAAAPVVAKHFGVDKDGIEAKIKKIVM